MEKRQITNSHKEKGTKNTILIIKKNLSEKLIQKTQNTLQKSSNSFHR